MKIVIAPDSFKGSLSAFEVAHAIAQKANEYFPQSTVLEIPVADGGEGTLDVLISGRNLNICEIEITGPDLRKQKSIYAYDDKTAYIEMARLSGITMMDTLNPMTASSRGLGEAICDALDKDFKNFYIAIGGSATNDGGMGMMTALGVRFIDEYGHELLGNGENLAKIKSIDISGLHPMIFESAFNIICDVKNPLLGCNGATFVFGSQKGADENELKILESGMQNYVSVLKRTVQKDMEAMPGSGAAGGVGYALMTFLSAKFNPGIDTILNIIDFDNVVKDADLVITGEGNMDFQSVFGKAAVGVASHSKNAKCIALVGGLGEGYEDVYEHGIDAVYSVFHRAMSLSVAIENSHNMLNDAADRMMRIIKASMTL